MLKVLIRPCHDLFQDRNADPRPADQGPDHELPPLHAPCQVPREINRHHSQQKDPIEEVGVTRIVKMFQCARVGQNFRCRFLAKNYASQSLLRECGETYFETHRGTRCESSYKLKKAAVPIGARPHRLLTNGEERNSGQQLLIKTLNAFALYAY